jgi:hypothetical protein
MGTRHPMGSGLGLKFHSWLRVLVRFFTRIIFVMGWIFATPDPDLTHCHPYLVSSPVIDRSAQWRGLENFVEQEECLHFTWPHSTNSQQMLS